MQIYLVGGAVRDALLQKPIKEKDWVVVGATAQEMLASGYKQVGKDFPVFLHPKTKEEYALARTERKVAPGYDGFVVHADPKVTLKEDLLRRDLTINAIAQAEDGTLIDYFGGQDDIKQKKLRHVSDAFVEDPLRLVRLCRFQARFFDFTIDQETVTLCQTIVQNGEVNHLTPERVWLEWQKVLHASHPELFILTLERLGAWRILMPMCVQPELDSQRLQQARRRLSGVYLLGVVGWYLSEDDLKTLLRHLKLPKEVAQIWALVHQMQSLYNQTKWKMSSEKWVRVLYRWDAFRRRERLIQAYEVFCAGFGRCPFAQEAWEEVLSQLKSLQPDPQCCTSGNGEEIAQNLRKKREEALSTWLKKHPVE